MEALGTVLAIAIAWFGWQWNKFVFERKSNDFREYVEWLKNKYWNKPKDQ